MTWRKSRDSPKVKQRASRSAWNGGVIAGLAVTVEGYYCDGDNADYKAGITEIKTRSRGTTYACSSATKRLPSQRTIDPEAPNRQTPSMVTNLCR